MAVAVAGLLASSDVSNDEKDFGYEAYRLLLGVDLRRRDGFLNVCIYIYIYIYVYIYIYIMYIHKYMCIYIYI